jgi:hypothetical protein
LNPGSSIKLALNQKNGKVKAVSSTGTNYDFIFNPSDGTLSFNVTGGGSGGDEGEEDCTTTGKFYIIGSWDNWVSWNEMQKDEKGHFYFHANNTAQFKVSPSAG